MNNALYTHLEKLIRFESVTPKDAGAQAYLASELSKLGFTCTQFDNPPVSNLYAQYGTCAPLLIFAGHTDVVAPGPIEAWQTPPYTLTEKKGLLYGRGVADMKGAIAAMLVAAKRLVNTPLKGSIGFLITSGEEGEHYALGTPHVMAELKKRNQLPQYCIVGEPSCHTRIADTIKVGRRGSLHAHICIHGKQGHVAYPQHAKNPIHHASQALAAIANLKLDSGNAFFPPSSLQITNIQAGTGEMNVIPGQLNCKLNIRYSTEHSAESLQKLITDCFKQHKVDAEIRWELSGAPFLTAKGALLEVCLEEIENTCGKQPECSTSGGTSDGRFIAPHGVEVIELGLCNPTIHQVNECIEAASLEQLATLYEKIIRQLM